MQRLYPLFFSLAFAFSFFAQWAAAQTCGGTTGGGITGGVTSSSTGFLCANVDIPATPGSGALLDLRAFQVIDGETVTFEIDWNDGSAIQTVNPTKTGANSWEITGVKHYFPVTGAGVKCEYQPRVRLLVNGTLCNPNFGAPPSFIRWNTDNENSGVLFLREPTTGTSEYLVCRGTETTVYFEDRSTLNCVPPALAATSSPHDRRRWRMFRYGTTNTITSATGVKVGGSVRVYPYDGAVVQHALASGATTRNPPAPIVTDAIVIPADAQVGEIFEITMRYWNDCNPYPAATPVTSTARIRIVDQPPAPPVVNNTVCYGTTPLPAFQTTVTGTPTINWFRDNAGVPGAAIINPAGATSKTLATSAYPPSGISSSVPGVYKVWVSYTMVSNPDGKACESPRVPITLTIVEDLTQPAAITGPAEVCNGGSVAFSLPAAGTAPNGGSISYEWSVTGGTGVTVNTTTATTATFDVNVGGSFTSTTRTIQVRKKYDNGSGCPSPYRTLVLTIYGPSQGGTVAGGGSFCQGTDPGMLTLSGHRGDVQRWEVSTNGGPFAATGLPLTATVSPGVQPVGTYTYRAAVANGLCSEVYSSTVTITVVPPASAGLDQAWCQASLVSGALDGSDPAPATGVWSIVSQPPASSVIFNSGTNARNTTITVSKVGVYVLRWTVGGACSDDVEVDFGTDPGPQSAGANASVCGTSYTLNGSVPAIGTGTWSLVTGPAGGTVSFSDPNAPNATVTLTGTITFNSIYRLKWEVASGTCPARLAVVDLIFSRPATASVQANFTSCVNSVTLAPIPITGTVGDGAGATQRGRWEIVSGTGQFTSANANPGTSKLGPTITDSYKPSAGDYATGSVQLRLVALDPDGGTRPCGNENSPTLTITFDKIPGNVNAGSDKPLLCLDSELLDASVPTNGTGSWSDPLAAGVTFADPALRNTNVSGLPIGATTLRWTVASALGVCAPVTDDVILTRHPLPTVNNLMPEICENPVGSGSVSNVVLTTNDNAVTGGAANTTVEWFTDAVPAGPVAPASTPQTLSTASPASLTFFTRVTNSATTCKNTGSVIYTITPLPAASPYTKAFCEDFPVGSNKVDNIDLTAADFINGVTGGVANRSVSWFLDAAATAQPIATPSDFDIVGSKVVYARIRNTVTSCENVAQVNVNIKSRPLDQLIQGKEAVCKDALELYQVSAVPSATYQWTIPAQFDNFLGGGAADFLALLAFPTETTGDIKLKITVDGCDGNELTKHIEVSPTPTPFTINVPGGTICENQIGVPFSVTPNNYPSSNYNWEIDPLGGALVATGQTTNNVLINFLSADVTIKVTESNASNCAGPPQQTVVLIKKRPTLADLSNEVCSEDICGITLAEAATSDVPAPQYEIISVAVDPGLIALSGPTVGVVGANGILNDKFENPSGGTLRVRYTIAPISADGCAGPSKTVQLTVKPEPILDVTLWGPVCSGTAISRVLEVKSGSVPADFFIIDSVVPDAGLTPLQGDPLALGSFDKNVLSDDVWQNQTSGVLQVTYNIRPYNSISQCTGTPAVPMVFSIYPEPVVDAAAKTICSGVPVNLMPSSTNLPTSTFAWKAGAMTGVSGASDGVGATINDILTNIGTTAGTAVYTVTATGPVALQSCESQGRDITITVNPAPAVDNISATLCSDQPGGNTVEKDLTTLEADITSTGGVTFTWYSDAGLTTQIMPPALNAYAIGSNTPVYAKVDNGTCFNVATVTYIINPLPQVFVTLSQFNGFNISCNGSGDAQVTANANSGTEPYLYSINNGINYFPTTTFNSLQPGVGKVVTVKDNKNCVVTSAPFDIIEPPALTISGTPAAAKCKGDASGSIQVTAGGGVTGTYTYSLNGGTFQVSPNFPGLSAGTHTITVKDVNNCTKSTTVSVGEPTLLTGSITAQTNVGCNGESTGSVTVAGNGGTGAYEYALDANPFQASGTFGTLPAGTYTVTVKDANDCTSPVTVVITEPAVLTLNLSVKTDVKCNGNSNGAMTVAGSGGTSPYEYSKDGGGAFQSSGVFGTLTAGTYAMQVRDAKGCIANLSVTINQPPVLSGTITSQTNVLCNGTSTGSVTVNGAGGSGIYQFQLNAGAFGNSGTFGTLAAGSYTVTVRDQNNCSVAVPVTITEPSPLGGSVVNQSEVSCNGGGDGTVEVAGSGGVAPYQYNLNGAFVPLGSFTGLAAGNHTVIVRDANLCTFSVPFTITEPTQLTGAITLQHNVDCKGNATGDVTVQGADGTPPYEYSINGSAPNTTGFFDVLTVGSYTVRIRDSKGCLVNVPVTITEPDLLTLAVQSKINVDCHGNSTGSVTLQAAGGTAPYQYADATLVYDTDPSFGNLAAGLHSFTVRDAHGCETPISVTITEPDVLTLSNLAQTNVLCHGQNSGSVTVQASGGSGSYEYSKNGTDFSPLNVFGGLTAGAYTITVRDAKVCKTTLAVTITEPDALQVMSAAETNKVSCFLGSDGELTVTATGGNTSLPYTFLLLQDPSNTSGQTTGVFGSLRASSYTVRITDVNNCSLVTPVIPVTQPAQLKVSGAVTSDFNGYHISCENAADGVIEATVTGGTGPGYTYAIAPDPNNVVSNTTGRFTGLPAGLYTITVTDANLCSATSLPVIINPPFPLTAGFIGFDQFVCINNNPAVISSIVAPFGGTEDYIFQWQQSTDNVTFTDIPGEDDFTYDPPVLAQTTYYKRVVTLASGGCGALESNVVTVTINPLPVFNITANPAEACEGDAIFINLNFTTGQSPFRYDYTKTDVNGTVNVNNQIGGATTPIPVFNYRETATFTVTRVRDFNGCEIFPNQSISVNVKKIDPSFTIDGPASQCGGATFNFKWKVDADVEYTWEWADGSAPLVIPANSLSPGIQTIPHTFTALPPTNTSTFIPVTLSAESVGLGVTHCGPKRFTQNIELFPSVYIDVPTPASPICSGARIDFMNQTQGSSVDKWYYRVKGSTDQNFVKNTYLVDYTFENNTASNPITYEVVYEGGNARGCKGSKAMDIIVYKNSVATIGHNPVAPVFQGGVANVTFENQSSLIEGATFSYEWDFGANATPPVDSDEPGPLIPVTYSSPGTKRVTLTVTNRQFAACKTADVAMVYISVPPLTADFKVKPLFACSPATITVENIAGAADAFTWTLSGERGDVSTSNLVHPTFVIQEAGIYSITLEAKLTATNQTVTRTVENITVYGRPQAIFTARPTQFFVPDVPVNLANDSQGANAFEWTFGDGGTSTEIEPNYQYELEGTYVITLKALNDHGNKDIDGDGVPDGNVVCYDTTSAVVVGREGGATKIPNAFTPNPSGPTGGIDNGAGMNDVFLPITSGVQEFNLQIFDRWGNLIYESKDKNMGWDGYDKDGRLMPAGVYVYKLVLRLADDQRETRIGDVTLIR